jgi:hypothetical protein
MVAKLFLPGQFFPWKKTGFFHEPAKTCQPCHEHIKGSFKKWRPEGSRKLSGVIAL